MCAKLTPASDGGIYLGAHLKEGNARQELYCFDGTPDRFVVLEIQTDRKGNLIYLAANLCSEAAFEPGEPYAHLASFLNREDAEE